MGIVILLLSSCNVLKFVPKGKSLVDANFIKVEGDDKIENLKEEVLLVPNRKMLGVVKFNLWSYYFGQKIFKRDSVIGRIVKKEKVEKEVKRLCFRPLGICKVKKLKNHKTVTRGYKVNKAKKLFTEIIGEKPVYLDTAMVHRSEKNLKKFIYLKGYYNVTVTSKVKTYLKRSYVTYTIVPGKPYVIRKIIYNGSDFELDKAANEYAGGSDLKIGDKVDTDKLSLERDRLTTSFRNNGFYYFNKAFIEIATDTGGHDRGANVYFNISNPGALRNARQQTIQKVVVEMNFNPLAGRRDTVGYGGIKYLFNGYNIKPNIINRSVKLRPKELFSQEQLEATYKKLIGLGLFKSVNISILPYKSDSTNKVLVYISLTPMSKHDYIWEPQTITSDKQTDLNSQDNNPRNYGIANTLTLNNKNVFRNAEDINVRWRFAAEKQFGNAKGVDVKIFNQTINVGNYESNLTAELLFPKLVGLRKLDIKPFLQQNRTSVNVTMLIEKNNNYERNSLPINFTWQTSYETKSKLSFYFFYSPVQLSFNSSKINSDFYRRLNNANDSARLASTFRNYIIPSQKGSIVFSNMRKSPTRYWNIRSNLFELSGNLVELWFRINHDKSKDKELFGIPYFQYFRTDIDAVRYRIFGKNKTLVYRLNVGYGTPYGNSTIMPFERQFFVGGSNSLRGWRPRVLGPGNYNNTSSIQIDKTGDMMIVANVEYRFAIAPGKLDGAFFFDAGNIWEVTKSAPEESQFHWNSFITQAALNTGIGLRLNLEFFWLRFDFGVPLYDPSYVKEERWVAQQYGSLKALYKNTNFSLAVGLPF